MNHYPNLDRLAHRDPDTLTAREVQVVLICRDANTPSTTKLDQAERTVRLGRDVPALLAHIDELYGEINDLKAKCGKQADMLARHCQRRDEVLAVLDRFNTVPADDEIAETLIDSARNLLGGAR